MFVRTFIRSQNKDRVSEEMKKKERVALGIAVSLTVLLGSCMLFAFEFSIPFCLLGLIGAGILMRDEKTLKWGAIFLFLIFVIVLVAVAVGGRVKI